MIGRRMRGSANAPATDPAPDPTDGTDPPAPTDGTDPTDPAPDPTDGTDATDATDPTDAAASEAEAKTPLYPRLLRLRHIHPSAWQRAVLGEGALAVAVVLVLADLASAWTLLVLPLVVAVFVKAHDLLAGALAGPMPVGPGDEVDPLLVVDDQDERPAGSGPGR